MIKENPSVHERFLPLVTAVAMFMQSLDGTILNTSLPSIAKSMNYSPLEMQSVIVSYTLTLALFIPLSGWLSDRFGTKKNVYPCRISFYAGIALLCHFDRFVNIEFIADSPGNRRFNDGSHSPISDFVPISSQRIIKNNELYYHSRIIGIGGGTKFRRFFVGLFFVALDFPG